MREANVFFWLFFSLSLTSDNYRYLEGTSVIHNFQSDKHPISRRCLTKLKTNKNMPDFKQLEDRVIANPSSSPKLVIKTNLDPKDVTEDNPYLQNKAQDEEEFKDFFEK